MQMTKNLKKGNLENFGIALFLAGITFIFLLKSPLHIWIGADAGTDSSVFKTVALMMDKGYMPYRDSFDHKGPLIYLINLLGMKISTYRGVWVMEFAAVFITFTAIYKIARLCCGKILSCISLLASVSVLFDYFESCNQVEEYAMPFIAVSLYIFLDYFMNQKITKFRLLLCGAGLGAVCMLRPNMVSVWVVFSIAVFVQCIREHRISDIKEFLLYFLLGFSVVVLPIMIWLVINNAFRAFLEDYIQFNRIYISAEGGRAFLSTKWYSFFVFLNEKVTLFAVIISVYLCKERDKFLYGSYLVYILCTLFFMCLSGVVFKHYGMILAAAAVFPIASFYDLCSSQLQGKPIILIATVYLLGTIVLPGWLPLVSSVVSTYEDRNLEHRSDLVRAVCDIVDRNTSEEDCISVYGNWNLIYVLSDRKHATKYSYQFPIGVIVPDIMDEYFEELGKELPSVMVIQAGRFEIKMKNFLEEHAYREIWNEEKSNGQLVRIFKRFE